MAVMKCCSKHCDSHEECTLAFFCDRCGEPIEVDEEYYEVDVNMCENCWDNFVSNHIRRYAKRKEIDI